MDHRKQQRSPSPRSGGSSGKHGGKGASKAGGSGGKKPIKVVYISNPMRVKTSEAGFRALVQELTGRHADPSKYNTDDGRAAQELSPEGSAAGSTPDAGAPGSAAAGGQPELAAAAFGDGEEEDIFESQLLDNDYAVFSPSTFLYDYPHSNKV
ncbi:uncharacterized protein LOC119277331 [Triticum dicoccoides]|uniref:uncharacterized protein LOC119277331 n=1 Tax=Triticum dicoccoides TaxID=85692 RepID=UPI00188FA7DB|nr:uncharacterized protein LOC119277331 [Triticum dicoccoides]